MNQPAENLDALDQYTKFSYDGIGRLIKTKNADTSTTLNSYSYYDSLVYTFGTVKKVIEKQRFTDEEGNYFDRYFDAVGSLRREVKFLDIPNEDFPFNALITDYKYDSLYRVTQVKTPEGKNIYYSYDGYGRQSKRITPDAGQTDYIYDKNSNLTYSQDANQRNEDNLKYTFRNYDGLNRLTGIGEAIFEIESPYDGDQFTGDDQENYLSVNVYDTITSSVVNNLFSPPNGYTSPLFTKGNLVSTAYRTRSTDDWNFKYYKYDFRGRVIKLWNIITRFDTLVTEYQYNSQDQITIYSHSGHGDFKTYRNIYDYAGRMMKVDYYTGAPDAPNPDYLNIAEYEYNPNSQISIQKYNDAFMQSEYSYNERSWITAVDNSSKLFEYSNQYFKNGNVKSMEISGDYSLNFAVPSDLTFDYEYDRSNRLTQTKNTERNFTVVNTYDKDGNILTLDRNGSTGNSIDDFNYSYFSGTNKLSKVTGSVNQYAYDANGNMTRDDLNKNFDIIYDHRNLIVQLKQLIIDIHGSKNDTTIYQTFYYYDEAGNRIRKMTYDTEDDSLKSDIIYSRDVNGRELAVYENDSIKQWNLFGLDNIGYMTGSDDLRFYLKDHLGSVRVVTDNLSAVINCQDYDPWGFLLENRVYESDESVYKFTSKERDEESLYDYFGARYYDARIGRWGQVEPLMDKYVSFSPYQYSMLNPLLIKDINGKDGKVTITGNKISLEVNLYFSVNSETNPQGLTDKQITAVGEFQQKVENSYSGKFEINGKNYEVTTKFNLILEDSYEKAVITRFENEGSNVIENGGPDNELLRKADFGVGVTSGYDLILASGSALNPDIDTGEHELVHLLGLKGDDPNDSSVENYGRPRQKPNGETFKKFFDVNKVNIKSNETQILRGYIK